MAFFESHFLALGLLSTAQILCGLVLVWGLSLVLAWSQVRELPRWAVALAVLGFQTSLLYLKPRGISFAWILVVPLGLAYGLYRRSQCSPRVLAEFFLPLKRAPIIGIFLYSFVPFFFRWEPAGSDPVKWGSFARLIREYVALPGETWPLCDVSDIHGINLGLPVAIALLQWASRAPWERVIFFLECLSLAGIAFAWASVLERFFSRKAAETAAFVSLVLFTNPQQFLNWGGTPTLVGMMGGFLVIWILRSDSALSRSAFLVAAFSLAGAAHAHPIGIYLSLFVVLAFLPGSRSRQIKTTAGLGLASLVAFSPFLLKWGNEISPEEYLGVQKWQSTMTPYLFRPEHSLFYNLYTQVSAYYWNTAFWIAIVLAIAAWAYDRRAFRQWGPAFLITLVMVFIGVLNVLSWFLPLSFLFYPERMATAGLLLLIFPLAYWAEKLPKAPFRYGIYVVIAVLGVAQFRQRLLPNLHNAILNPAARRAIAKVADFVPPGSCVNITFLEAGMWLPVLSLRCTVPYHVLSESVQDEQAAFAARPVHYVFLAPGEISKTPVKEWLIDEEGYRLGKITGETKSH